jgi:hypothetical protein
MFLPNFGIYLQVHTVLQPRIPTSARNEMIACQEIDSLGRNSKVEFGYYTSLYIGYKYFNYATYNL